MMGAHVLEQRARCTASRKLVHRRHGLRLPEVHAGAVPRGRPLERLPGGDERAVRRREEGAARRRAGLPRAVRHSTRSSCCPANLYGPRDNFDLDDVARDPGADPQDGRARPGEVVLWGDGSPTREFLYVDDCAEGARARRRALRRRRAGQPRHRRRDLDPRARRDDRRADRLRRARSSGTRRCRTASRAGSSTRRARGSCSASRAQTSLRDGLERTIAWYRESSRVPA